MNKKTKILNCQEPLKINTEGLGLGFVNVMCFIQ